MGQEANPFPASGFHWLVLNSRDGVDWRRQSGPTNNGDYHYLNAAAFGGGSYVVAGRSGLPTPQGLVLTSTNLTTWTPRTGFPSSVVNGLAYGKGTFVAVGARAIDNGQLETLVVTSSDGVQWTNRSSGIQGRLSAVAFGGDCFVAVGEPQLILSSTDAINWTQRTTIVDGFLGVTYGSGSFIAVGGYYTDLPRGVAVQSGGRPQLCLEPLGFGPSWNPGFRLLMTAEHGRSYRLQSSTSLPAVSWKDVDTFTLPPGYPDPVQWIDQTAPPNGVRFYQVVSP